ncbi:WD40-repeat-containing domain protein [Parachaetomium inaequale]|uniref:WD40-repeat-containing domain protein n=1 Tax=Parachaetomium inaequale TaxID=2588326 RepID=A0AAN6SL93_9PEZI|nr:WD40-repeat-containing domain protein [Parachaetomium inaequale]
MSETLRGDIYDLRHPGYPIDQVKQPEPDPLATVHYSCVYWVDHLHDCDPARNAPNELQDSGSIDKFLRRNYLHWLEALSLIRSMSEGTASLMRLKKLLQGEISQLAHLVRDGCRFIQYNKWAIESSPLQVIIRNLFRNEEPRWIVTNPITLEGHSDSVTSVAWSHDVARLASASYDSTCIATLEGHSSRVTSVAWSYNAARLVSASWDRTVKIWDAITGQCIATLEGYSDSVTSVAWSYNIARLVSASLDTTLVSVLYDSTDTITGRYIATLEGHYDAVTSCIATLEAGQVPRSLQFDISLSRRLHTDVGTFDLPPALSSTALARTGYSLSSNGTWIRYRGENLL